MLLAAGVEASVTKSEVGDMLALCTEGLGVPKEPTKLSAVGVGASEDAAVIAVSEAAVGMLLTEGACVLVTTAEKGKFAVGRVLGSSVAFDEVVVSESLTVRAVRVGMLDWSLVSVVLK